MKTKYRIALAIFTIVQLPFLINLVFHLTSQPFFDLFSYFPFVNLPELTRRIKTPKRCSVPELDPFHADVLPLYKKNDKKPCTIRRYGTIANGSYSVNVNWTVSARMTYIERIDDFHNKELKWISLERKDDRDRDQSDGAHKTAGSCFMVDDTYWLTIRKERFTYFLVVSKEKSVCAEETLFQFKDGYFKHAQSDRCLVPEKPLPGNYMVRSVLPCHPHDGMVHTTEGYIKHVQSGLYLKVHNQKIKLAKRRHASIFISSDSGSSGGTYSHPVKEGFLKVELKGAFGRTHEEYHVILPPVPSPSSSTHGHPSSPNIILVMVDSVSHANVQRQMSKTYKRLKDDSNTVILKGHTIAGDGTTAQVGAFLTGIAEKYLPEARKSFKGAETVDRYPFIFRELHKKGYETYFSEDSPGMATFNYRLKGFRDPPTGLYLRPLWIAMEDFMRRQENSCEHEIAFEVTKQFLLHYPASLPKFAFPMIAGLAHGDFNKAGYIDDDLIDLFDFFDSNGFLDNSFVFVFADHGARMGSIRSTLQGKLEERLPFMSVTTPRYFKNRYPAYMRNLRDNGEMLTSHFDFHETLRHIISLEGSYISIVNSTGQSLFADYYDRTCIEVGTEPHWCPCLKFQSIPKNNSVVETIAGRMVQVINGFFSESPLIQNSCAKLSLKSIERAGRRSPNENVTRFDSSKRNEECDSCGVVYQKDALPTFLYELVLEVSPSNALFEASAEVSLSSDKQISDLKIKESYKAFSRLNKYGDQPLCIAEKHPHLRKYCYCQQN